MGTPKKIPFAMFKPFVFIGTRGWVCDGKPAFQSHGIFEIVGLDKLDTESPVCEVRRIGTASSECPLGEKQLFHAGYLAEYATLTNWESFGY